MKNRTPLVVLAVAIFGLVMGGAIYGAIAEPDVFDPASPEGVVQSYVQAAISDDWPDARQWLVDPAAEDCDKFWYVPSGISVYLGDVTYDGDTARVSVDVQQGDSLDPWTTTERFVLSETDSGWRIAAGPWLDPDCER